ncbi:sn-glycerol-3-phosphate ABC transporter ATP-binding protein UgpC [Thiospirochaeta perfilievii]|uniref:sn-glycerol-3-phosphate ABC transporter ATP-binding protein UgpC n=1 Tax=Thiospirochaeta perfilievii TaxID=252967 RepID=A0A5C1QGU3_9SPIO|nr:sn-glycerol-3-phosphate ABC transporter ATP-binding protein UgpC [Thiospirochaeta perfilievii]QEN05452.1 sn-glycerol-3-phosphate ABC transporter ATP-binding protein UgpC [Thiospirochaeta perfilievii]
MAEVKLKDIVKVYDGGVKAVDNVNIDIKDEEFVVLVGPSGCGKSTTLRMIAGLEDITDGELTIDGKRMNEEAPKDRDIAMVFQNYALYPHMTVRDNMAFGLKIRKYAKEEIESRVAEAAGILEIEELLDRKPKALSGGQRQRVAVGRAIVRKPKVFLFDEPLSNLDAKLRVQMRTEISALHTRLQATMIYVTHDQIEAMTMGDKIVVMKGGVIQQIGSPLSLYNEPINQFVASFIGSPAMNTVRAKVREENGKVIVDEGGFVVTVPADKEEVMRTYVGKDVLMGIRPEDSAVDTSATQAAYIKGTIEVVEPLGDETILYVSTADHQIVCKVEPTSIVKVGEELTLTPNVDKIKFFDIETEKSIFYKG